MLTTIHSNRLERLAERLCERLCAGPIGENPFDPELIVVQNPGMARWLSLQIADRLGVTANVRFPLPARFIWQVLGSALDSVPEQSAFQMDVMAWRIMERLATLGVEPGFETVRAYLAQDTDRGRFELAREIARVFDQYLLFRPDWIERWESGEDDHWQAQLWRALSGEGEPHWISLRREFFSAVEKGEVVADSLPGRASLFGIPALSPGYMETIRRLGGLMNIDVYQLNPSREFWQDILARKAVAQRVAEHPEEEPYLETANPLLASMGRHIQEHIAGLQSGDEPAEELFVDPTEDSVLHCLQHDMLVLQERRGTAIPAGDDSLQIHVCHSAKREVEVLHDRLLDLMERHDDLSPSDVIVMTPDINSYAPWIEAVFGASEETGTPSLHFSVADRDYRRERPVISAVFRLLEQESSRFTAPEVLSLLDIDAVQRRFHLSPDDVTVIANWLRESGVRWAWDAKAREELGLPGNAANTWTFGLDRLLLGYALPHNDEGVYRSILPCDLVEGGDSAILGRLMRFLDALNELRAQLRMTESIDTWASQTLAMLDTFLAPDRDDEADMNAVRKGIESVRQEARRAGFKESVSASVFATRLGQSLESGSLAGRFLAGGITFCGLVPMRSVPFRVVCLVGLGEGEFPRQVVERDFDLMVGKYRAGDRSRRDDDRYLFLEALLSARDHLYLSYTGRNNRDDTEIPPSPLVSELMDYLETAFEGNGIEEFVTAHPLQPFSRRYFEDPDSKLFSYSQDMCRAAQGARNQNPAGLPFLDGPLPGGDESREVSLDELKAFLGDTARFLLREELEITFQRQEAIVEDHEPFELDTLTANSLRQELLAAARSGQDPDSLVEIARGTGWLPPALLGERIADSSVEEVVALQAELAIHEEQRLDARDWSLQIGDWTVTGRFGEQEFLTPNGLVGWFTSDKVWINQRVHIWLWHLALNAVELPDVASSSRWYYPGLGAMELPPVEGAAGLLESVLELYDLGRTSAAPFFPRSAWAAAKSGRGDPVAAVERKLLPQEVVLIGGYRPEGELERPEFGLVFRDQEVNVDELVALGRRIFGPMVACLPRPWLR